MYRTMIFHYTFHLLKSLLEQRRKVVYNLSIVQFCGLTLNSYNDVCRQT